jgi:5-methylcytosine-specific restriction endonuclease McrA
MKRAEWMGGVSDEKLLERLHAALRDQRRADCELLRLLLEVERRRLHAREGCSSLYIYCVEVLNIPEPSAYNRLKAARAAGRFPVILEMLAAGELHLTGIALLEPHLTEDNHRELLAACRRQSKRKIQELLAARFPQADRRPVLRPLPTPAPRVAPETESRAPAAPPAPADRQQPEAPVDRQQPEAPTAAAARGGDAPQPGLFAATPPGGPASVPASTPASPTRGGSAAVAPGSTTARTTRAEGAMHGPAEVADGSLPRVPSSAAGPHLPQPGAGAAPATVAAAPAASDAAQQRPGPATRLEPTGPERYRLSVTLSRCTHDKLRRAQALLRHRLPAGDLEAVLDSALDALLGQLEKRKAARVERPRPAPTTAPVPGRPASRHIPAHVRREVWERDGGQCSFVSAAGRRCGETGFLEYDHITPFAQGGAATVDNIRLLCRAHNQARVAPEVARRAAREVCREHQRQAPGTVAGSRRSAGEAGSAPRAPAQAHASRPRAGAAESHGGCMNATHRGPRGKSQQACDDGSGPRPVKRTAVEPVPVEEMPRHSECAVTCAAEHASDAG